MPQPHIEDGSTYRAFRPNSQQSEKAGVRRKPQALAESARACGFPYTTESTHRRSLDTFHSRTGWEADYSTRVKVTVKVLDFVQLGGPFFAVWIVGVGIFGIQVKGGKYRIIDGQWFLITDRGRSLRESPVPGTWDAAMAIRDVVQEQLHLSRAERNCTSRAEGNCTTERRGVSIKVSS